MSRRKRIALAALILAVIAFRLLGKGFFLTAAFRHVIAKGVTAP